MEAMRNPAYADITGQYTTSIFGWVPSGADTDANSAIQGAILGALGFLAPKGLPWSSSEDFAKSQEQKKPYGAAQTVSEKARNMRFFVI